MKTGMMYGIGFLLMICWQLFFPLQIIVSQDELAEKGMVYNFKVVGRDPLDPFRGHYLALNFPRQTITLESEAQFMEVDQKVFATYITDADGFAQLDTVFPERPATDYYLWADVWSYYHEGDSLVLNLGPPATRFYLNEQLAVPAENYLRNAIRMDSLEVYAQIAIYQGQAQIQDIIVGDQNFETWKQDLDLKEIQ